MLFRSRTDNRTNQIQFMYDDPMTIYSGHYTKTHIALATALRGISSDNGYQSAAFDKFLENIPVVAGRLQNRYNGSNYPNAGFLANSAYSGKAYDPVNGSVNQAGSDVLIPAFMAAYSGKDAKKVTLNPFPGLQDVLPNWTVTYDGLGKISAIKRRFKNFTLSHSYQCTYQVGSFTSYSDWVSIGNGLGFTEDALTGKPVPSSPYNISSVSLTERFAPLIGVNATLTNDLNFNLQYNDSRQLTLNSSAGQLVEGMQRQFVIGIGYKIANFNSVLKIKKKQQGVNNDLTLNLDFSYANDYNIIRKIDVNSAQATSGARTLGVNFTANYVVSKRITLGAYFDHQVNTPLVSSSAYPTTNSNYGLSVNMSLAK